MTIKEQLSKEISELSEDMIQNCINMVQISSVTPPSDSIAMVEYLKEYLKTIPGLELEVHEKTHPIRNVVGILKSGKPGKRLVFNGHLDTYSVGNLATWDESPWSGIIKDNHIYGRGSSDMKGGIACFLAVLKVLANNKDLWSGEVVITLASEEEAMGAAGTQFLLETVEAASGDAMICADVGAPSSLRFGQKGLMWITLEATGFPAHGAHLHKGKNAITKMAKIMPELIEKLDEIPVNAPDFVTEAILKSASISEKGAGPGETEILQKTTINFGTFVGGSSPNLVAEYAKVEADIRQHPRMW